MAEADRPKSFEQMAEPSELTGPGPAPQGRLGKRLLMFGVPVLLALVGGWFWLTGGQFASTDNAYVKQDIVSVSSDLSGRIIDVRVRENQQVKAGDILFVVDPEPYKVALHQADADIAGAQVKLRELQTEYAGTGYDIEGASSAVATAREEYARQNELMKRGFSTRAKLEQAQNAVAAAVNALNNAKAEAAKARAALATGAQVPGVNPALAVAAAQREKAALDLSRTLVRAPVDGRVSQTSRLQIGQMMITGLPAVSIVANDRSWVEANFKETDLDRMRPGQTAQIRFDAYPGLALRGHVESIGGGTGAQFSVLPAQNANGNWVKVTQRVPVRIAIDEKPARPLIAGLSSAVRVRLRAADAD